MSTWAGDERPDVWCETTRRARKEHKCCACRETIKPGNKYHVITSIYDCSVETWKRCTRCEAIYQHLDKRMEARHREAREAGTWVGCREDVPEMALDCGHTYEEEWGEQPSDKVAELAFLLPGESPGSLLESV